MEVCMVLRVLLSSYSMCKNWHSMNLVTRPLTEQAKCSAAKLLASM